MCYPACAACAAAAAVVLLLVLLQLWNQRISACSRPHVLLPAQQELSLAPTSLALTQQTVGTLAAAAAVAAGSNGSNGSYGGSGGSRTNGSLSLNPAPLSELGLHGGGANVTVLLPRTAAAAGSNATAATAAAQGPQQQWPPQGGEPIDCPVEIRGSQEEQQQQQTVVDVAFTRGLFAVSGPAAAQMDAATVGAAATAAVASLAPLGGVLRLDGVAVMRLPQVGLCGHLLLLPQAPELLLHGHASRASDVYALCILLVRLAAGWKENACTGFAGLSCRPDPLLRQLVLVL